jgi:thiopurine S-methyltransferase
MHDIDYWEQRYENKTDKWDLGHVSEPLRNIIDTIGNKNYRILIPGAGNAYEAEYLIKSGFTDVTVLDLAATPLLQLKKRLHPREQIKIVQQDFFDHVGTYDVILEQTFLCALEPRFRKSYIIKSHELLKKDGFIQGVLFNFQSKRNEPPYTATLKEYENLFRKRFEIVKLENCLTSEPSRQGKELIIKMKRND